MLSLLLVTIIIIEDVLIPAGIKVGVVVVVIVASIIAVVLDVVVVVVAVVVVVVVVVAVVVDVVVAEKKFQHKRISKKDQISARPENSNCPVIKIHIWSK